jgi:hypothetical protein
MCWSCSTRWDEKHIIDLHFRREHFGNLSIIGTVALKYVIKTRDNTSRAGPGRLTIWRPFKPIFFKRKFLPVRHIGGGFTAPFILTSTDAELRGQLHCPAALVAQEPTLSIE